MKLYHFSRSSASFRVRIALNLKGQPYELIPVHLRRGEQRSAAFLERNPQGFVPALETDSGTVLNQSLAIVEWLDETFPTPPLLPGDALQRARVRALALAVACDIHPLNNLQVLRYLQKELGLDEARRDDWYRHWIAVGFRALEGMLAADGRADPFCHGDAPTLADVFLVPQVVNAQRLNCDLAPYPTIRRVFDLCMELDAFAAAHPGRMPEPD